LEIAANITVEQRLEREFKAEKQGPAQQQKHQGRVTPPRKENAAQKLP
jgi:hypothetical protein